MNNPRAIQDAHYRGQSRRFGRLPLIVAAPIAVLSFALAAPALASGPPVIEGEGVPHVTQSDATLEATINTEGAEPASQSGAWYQFQLVKNPGEYQTSFACPERRIETGAPVGPPCVGAPPSQARCPLASSNGPQGVKRSAWT